MPSVEALSPPNGPAKPGYKLRCPLRTWRSRSRSTSRRLMSSRLSKVFLPPADAELDLDQPVLNVEAQGDQCQPPFGDPPAQAPDLVAVGEQLAHPRGVVVELIAECVRCYVQPHQQQLAVGDAGVGVGKGELCRLDRLDLGAAQRDAAFQAVVDMVEVARAAVVASVLTASAAVTDRRLTTGPVPIESRAPACTIRPAASRGYVRQRHAHRR